MTTDRGPIIGYVVRKGLQCAGGVYLNNGDAPAWVSRGDTSRYFSASRPEAEDRAERYGGRVVAIRRVKRVKRVDWRAKCEAMQAELDRYRAALETMSEYASCHLCEQCVRLIAEALKEGGEK